MDKIREDIEPKKARAEYIEVEPNVRLHVTDAGEGQVIVLIPGWPLSDEMYEYQYTDLINAGFRVIGITLRGFGKSDKPYGGYNYDVHALDIKRVLDQLEINDATLCGFSMGGAIAVMYVSLYGTMRVTKLVLAAAAATSCAFGICLRVCSAKSKEHILSFFPCMINVGISIFSRSRRKSVSRKAIKHLPVA